MNKHYYSKKDIGIYITVFIFVWIVAMISVFYNLKYSLRIVEAEQKINELTKIIEIIK